MFEFYQQESNLDAQNQVTLASSIPMKGWVKVMILKRERAI